MRGPAADSRFPPSPNDGVGGHVLAREQATASGLLSRDSQQLLWQRIIKARYILFVVIGICAFSPAAGAMRYSASIALLLVAIPYNFVYDAVMRRTGELHPTIGFVDNIVVTAFVALVPESFNAAALLLLAITATNVVAFGRHIAMQAAAVSYIGVVIVLTFHTPPDELSATFPSVLLLGLMGAFTIFTVGAIADDERDLRARYAELTDNIDAIVWERRRDQPGTVYVNSEVERVFGYPVSDWQDPDAWDRFVHPDDRAEVADRYREAVRHETSAELEYRMVAADGGTVWVQDRIRIDRDSSGEWLRTAGVMVDITVMKEAERQVGQYVDLVDNIQLALAVFGLDHADDDPDDLRVLAMNPEAARVVGLKADDLIGKTVREGLEGVEIRLDPGQLVHVIRTGQAFTIDEYRVLTALHGLRVYSVSAFPLPDQAVAVALYDITERTLSAEVLRRQALHDGLTGLPNRTLLNERVRNALKRARRAGSAVALLVMDLDQFKEVNDALGHEQGDLLLIEISRRLQSVVTEADTIARLGGDEFAVLLDDTPDEITATMVAQRIRSALEEPFQLGGITLQTAASIGIALSPSHGDDAETLAQRADVAMYAAKRSGTGASIYAAEHDQSSVRRLALLGELRTAILEDALRLHYQPSLDLDTGEVHSVEALVRWEHDEHGLLAPAEFIELAEVSGLIRPLTRWVIDNVLCQVRRWNDAGLHVLVGVNLSVKDLYDRELVPWLADRLDAWDLDASCLKLEITESQLMDDPLLALEVLGKLKALGAATSIDDFGTGYSSLAYLKHLPIDELKIDKSFVGNLVHDQNDLVIVRSTIDLSHNLGLSVVAEGIEDAATLHRLAELGCDRAQGFYVSRPLPAEQFAEWLQEHQRTVAAIPDAAVDLSSTDLSAADLAAAELADGDGIVGRPRAAGA